MCYNYVAGESFIMSRLTHQFGGALIIMIDKICLICGKEFKTYPYLVKKGQGKYCSHKCYISAVKQGIYPQTGFQNGHKDFNTPESLLKISEALKGKNHPNWKGGVRKSHYRFFIHKPNHPFAQCNGYVAQYRLIAEKCLSRYLTPKEQVHHIDNNPSNDKPKNLYLFSSNSEHMKYHQSKNKPFLKSNIN